MHYARVENSERLQRIVALLSDGEWHTTLDIIINAGVCAVSAAISEIRRNGYTVECRPMGRGRYEYLLR